MGDQVPKGKKSVAYGITYRALDRTLTDEEITLVQSKILTHLADELERILEKFSFYAVFICILLQI